ncbi:hypothetical protein UCMB321_4492 [Pseudomonas batumici]|uniref:Uncharacterized protein n=1 Tax=Pseudomonas batumici TaxID=226910 RepID=A0A0C2E7F5_9PSED|nr:hypothetical protein UCMB321_4492 [Pseudomonas batumici]
MRGVGRASTLSARKSKTLIQLMILAFSPYPDNSTTIPPCRYRLAPHRQQAGSCRRA